MQWVTRLVKRDSSEPLPAAGSQVQAQAREADATKLRQLWATYPQIRDENEKTARLLKIIPLFVKVFDEAELKNLSEMMSDVKNFAFTITRYFVKELRTNWKQNQSNEVNSKTILKVLGKEDKFQILKCIEILSVGMGNVEVICEASFPSISVQVLHLFFFLPNDPSLHQTTEAVLDQLLKTLIKLLSYRFAAVELLRTNTLALLFSLPCAECPPHNNGVRDRMQAIVLALIKHHMDSDTIEHLHKKACLQQMITRLKNNTSEFPADSIVGIVAVVFSCLKESFGLNKVLYDNWAEEKGYDLVVRLLLHIETSSPDAASRLLEHLTGAVYIGPLMTRPLQLSASSSSSSTGSGIAGGPSSGGSSLFATFPSERSRSSTQPATQTAVSPVVESATDQKTLVRNAAAFQSVTSYFLKSSQPAMQLKALEAILSVFAANPRNFALLQPLHTISHLFDGFERYSFELKDSILRLLVLVVTISNCVPFQELAGMSTLVNENVSASTMALIFQTTTKLVNFDPQYKVILQSAGLLDMLLALMKKFATSPPATPSHDRESVYNVLMDTITTLLEKSPPNVAIFRSSGGINVILSLVKHTAYRPGALAQLQQLLLNAETDAQRAGDITSLMTLLKTAPVDDYAMKIDALKMLRRVMEKQRRILASFRECGGFVSLVSLIMGLDRAIESDESGLEVRQRAGTVKHRVEKVDLLEHVFKTITIGLAGHPTNREFFQEQIARTLGGGLELTGVMRYPLLANKVIAALLDLAVENTSESPQPQLMSAPCIFNPEAIRVIFEVGSISPVEVQVAALQKINELLLVGRHNVDVLAKAGVLTFVLQKFAEQINRVEHPLHAHLLQFLELVGGHRLSVMELSMCMKLIEAAGTQTSPLVGILQNMVKFGRAPPFFEFDLRGRCNHACLHIPSLGERSWPPATGYTLFFWLFLDQLPGEADARVDIFRFGTEDRKNVISAAIVNEQLQVHLLPQKATFDLGPFKFQTGRWYHVALVHLRNRIQASDALLYVDGAQVFSGKVTYPNLVSSGVIAGWLGASPSGKKPPTALWRMGPLYLTEEILTPEAITTVYFLGPNYTANFQSSSFASCQTYEIVNAEDIRLLNKGQIPTSFDEHALLGKLDLGRVDWRLREDLLILAINAANSSPIATSNANIASASTVTAALMASAPEALEMAPHSVVSNAASIVGHSAAPPQLSGSVEAFAPSGIGSGIRKIGGLAVVFMLIERAQTADALFYAVGLLVALIRHNARNTREMEDMHGYEVAAYLLKRKSALLSLELANTLFELVGMYTDPHHEALSNPLALRYFFLDFEIWRPAPLEVQKEIVSRLSDLLVDNKLKAFNYWRLRKIHINHHVFVMLRDESLPLELLPVVMEFLSNFLLNSQDLDDDFITVYNHILGTLTKSEGGGLKRRKSVATLVPRVVIIRQHLLELLLNFLLKAPPSHQAVFPRAFKPLWAFPMLSYHGGHAATILITMKILVTLLVQSKPFYVKFKNASGFEALRELLMPHFHSSELFYILLCLVFGRSVREVSSDQQLDDEDLSIMFKASPAVFCPEALPIICSLLKRKVESLASTESLHTSGSSLPGHVVEELGEGPAPRRGSVRGRVLIQKSASVPQVPAHPHDEPGIAPDENDTSEVHVRVLRLFLFLLDSSHTLVQALRRAESLDPLVEALLSPQPSTSEHYRQACDVIYELLSAIVCSSFLTSNEKRVGTLETLDSVPVPVADVQQFIAFQSRLLSDIIAALRKYNRKALIDQPKLAANVGKFCSLVVDKICQGLYPSGTKTALEFMLEVLEKALGEDDPNSKPSAKALEFFNSVCRPLNRLVLYLLSNPPKAPAEEVPHFVQLIRKLTFHQRTVLSPHNNQPDFVQCLCQHLGRFLLADARELRDVVMGLWRLLVITKPSVLDEFLIYKNAKGEVVDLKRGGFELLLQRDMNAFSSWMADHNQQIRAVFDDQLGKVWASHVATENRLRADQVRQLKTRRETRLVQRQWEASAFGAAFKTVRDTVYKNFMTAKENEQGRVRKARQEDEDRDRFAYTEWARQRKELLRERSVWSTAEAGSQAAAIPVSQLTLRDKSRPHHWCLDDTEGPLRKRNKLEDLKEEDYHYAAPLPIRSAAHAVPSSTLAIPHVISTTASEDLGGEIPSASSPSHAPVLPLGRLPSVPTPSSPPYTSAPVLQMSARHGRSLNDFLDGLIAGDPTAGAAPAAAIEVQGAESSDDDSGREEEQSPAPAASQLAETETAPVAQDDEDEAAVENEKIQRLLEADDLIEAQYNCASISGMDKHDGVFLICTANVYIIDDYCINGLDEIVPIDPRGRGSPDDPAQLPSRPSTLSAALSGATGASSGLLLSQRSRRWSYEDLREVCKRRYLLQQVAIELFSIDGRNHLVTLFTPETRDEVLKLLTFKLGTFGPERTLLTDVGSEESLPQLDEEGGMKRFMAGVTSSMSEMIGARGDTAVTERWQAGKISNFQYLMYLNTLAGRSYNDLTQYPVFPWVLANYESAELDLNNPATFRDLSKPMGALNPRRAMAFKQRFESWDEAENNNVPKWHYGTHYSSAAVVLYYLIRLEPFTQQFLKLHSGRFDVPDRLFHSLSDTWQSAAGSTHNLADVKELTPEFYYLPELFTNVNNLELGTRSHGDVIGDVVLPPWAKNDPREFIRKHKMALESDYVSEHLHEWIDLIFGYKQQGSASIESLNVFYHLTYEGAVDIDTITDPTERASVIAQINNFGQTPTQLFKRPHPRRMQSTYSAVLLTSVFHPTTRLVWNLCKELPEAVGSLRMPKHGSGPIALGRKRALLPPANTRFFSWGYPDLSLRLLAADTEKVVSLLENPHEGQITCAGVTDDGKILVTGGTDTVVSVFKIQRGTSHRFKLICNLCGHLDSITCLAICRSHSFIVSGSQDRTCIIWDLNRLRYVRQLPRFAGHEHPISAIAVGELTGEIATCSGTWLNLWTLNGDLLLSKKTSNNVGEIITVCTMTKGAEWIDSHNAIITGHANGAIKVWYTSHLVEAGVYKRDLTLIWAGQVHASEVTAMCVSADLKKLYSGDRSGRVFLLTKGDKDDNSSEKKALKKVGAMWD